MVDEVDGALDPLLHDLPSHRSLGLRNLWPKAPWKVDRVLANQSLLLTAGTPSNIPFAWFLVLACNRQAWVSGGRKWARGERKGISG